MPRGVGVGGERARFWRGKLREHSWSGFSVRSFCRREGFSPGSFYRWRRILAERDGAVESRSGLPAPDPSEVFVPVSVADARDKPAGSSLFACNAQAGIELVFRSGLLLRVGPGFDSETLVRLVDLLD